MTEEKETLVVYIGTRDIQEWTQNEGKSILMPELLVGCEELLYKEDELEEILCARVEVILRNKPKAFDFKVKRDGVEKTLDKILEWALENEEYEICQRIKNLNEYISDKKFKF